MVLSTRIRDQQDRTYSHSIRHYGENESDSASDCVYESECVCEL